MTRSLDAMEAHLEVAGETPATESDTLRDRAMVLDQEAARLSAEADAARGEAALLRAKADRLDDPTKGVAPVRRRVRRDELMAAAGVAVESLAYGFTARDLAAALGIADVARASRIVLALADFGKVEKAGDGWRSVDPDETAVRDFVKAQPRFTLADVISACQLSELDASDYVGRLRERGIIEGAAGHYVYVPAPPHSEPRPRRRPPEKEPPAGTDAPKRGEPVRIVDHGKRAQATTRHREKLRDQRHKAMTEAREEAAERQRNRHKSPTKGRKKK